MKRLLFALWGVGLALVGCSSNEEVSGISTVETENALLIQVVDGESMPASNVVARVRSARYLQSTVLRDSCDSGENCTSGLLAEYTADSSGKIALSDSAVKAFSADSLAIEIVEDGLGAFAVIAPQKTSADGDSVLTMTMQLKKLGTLKGRIAVNAVFAGAAGDDEDDGDDESGSAEKHTKFWVQIYGTDRLVEVDKDGCFEIDSLPSFDYTLRVVSGSEKGTDEAEFGEKAAISMDVKANVLAGESTDVGVLMRKSIDFAADDLISEWMENAVAARKAGENVVGFIRLDEDNFDFDGTMSGGDDIKILKIGVKDVDEPLDFDIAYWNDSLKKAVIQVKLSSDVDSVLLVWGEGKVAADSAASINVWKDVPAEVVAEQNTITLIDFENGLASNLKAPALTGKWRLNWQGDSVVTSNPLPESTVQGLEEAGSGREGTAFHWTSESKNGSWSYIGLWISEPQRHSNLEALDSVEFYIRGQGSYAFSFESQGEESLKGKALFNSEVDSEEWKRIVVKPGDFDVGDSAWANLGWEMVSHQVTNINISAFREAELWVDDIKIYGVNLDDLK